MSERKSFMLRLNPTLFTALEKWAADEFRSVNGQIEWILDRSLKEHHRQTKENSTPPREHIQEGSKQQINALSSAHKGSDQSRQHADKKKP